MPQHRSPTNLATPRNRALDIGTRPEGFGADVDYDARAGMPSSPMKPQEHGGHHVEPPPAITPTAPSAPPAPFVVK